MNATDQLPTVERLERADLPDDMGVQRFPGGGVIISEKGKVVAVLSGRQAKALAKFLYSDACDAAMDEAEQCGSTGGHCGAVAG